MSVKVNEDKEIVKTIKEGLKKMVDIAHVDLKKQKILNVCVKNLENK